MTNNLPQNKLLHSFGLYNAIIVAQDRTLIRWNNTLGFSFAGNDRTWPVIDISDRPTILNAVAEWLKNNANLP